MGCLRANTCFRFCAANAETAHSLEHWRYHLFDWVNEWLDDAGHNTPEKVMQRDKMSERKRGKLAYRILDQMEREGKIRSLYKDFKQSISAARDFKESRWESSP